MKTLQTIILTLSMLSIAPCLAQFTGGEGRGDIMLERLNNQMCGAVLAVSPEGPISFCIGSSVTLTAESGFGSYTWSNGETGPTLEVTESGTYSVSVTDISGCPIMSAEVIVNVSDAPEASFTYEQTDGYTIEFSNTSSDGNEYLWNFEGGNYSTQSEPSFTFPFDGFYPVTLIVSNDCGSDTITAEVEVLKINNVNQINNDLNNIKIFPNPSQGLVTIELENNTPTAYKMRIINLLGQEIINESFKITGIDIRNIDLRQYGKGIYWIVIENGKSSVSKKIILI